MFRVNQFIEKNGQVGKVLEVYAFAYSVRVGEYALATWNKSDALFPSSEEAYNAQLASEEAKLQTARLAWRQKQSQPKTAYRWLCISCSTKFNGSTCPRCGSDERIYNTDLDTLDMSVLAEIGKGGPYAPRDDQ